MRNLNFPSALSGTFLCAVPRRSLRKRGNYTIRALRAAQIMVYRPGCVTTTGSRALRVTEDSSVFCNKELARYVADIVKWLRTCTKAPAFDGLQKRLLAAEAEANKIAVPR